MKRSFGKILIIAGLISLTSGCAGSSGSLTDENQINTIRDIQFSDGLKQTELTIVADRPLIYTSYELTNPDRLVVDLAGTSTGDFLDSIPVNMGSVMEIQPFPGEPPGHVSRLEIFLSEVSGSQIRAENSNLVIRVDRPSGLIKPGVEPDVDSPIAGFVSEVEEEDLMETEALDEPKAEASGVAAELEDLAVPGAPPAGLVTNLSFVTEGDVIKARIEGDGALHSKAFMVKGNRLVVDLSDVESRVRPNTIFVRSPTLEKIRIGQHLDPKKVRVVFDLNRESKYSVTPSGSEVVVEIMGQGPVQEKKKEFVQRVEEIKVDKAPIPSSEEKAFGKEAAVGGKTEMPPVETAGGYTGRRVSLDFQDAEIRNILRLLADVSGLNMVISDDVKGKVTLKLINVPWDQALEIVLKMNNLGHVLEGNIIRVATLANITKQRDEEARAKETLIKAEDLITRVIYVNYAKAGELSETLKKNLSPRGDITVDTRTNTMIVKDIEENLDDIVTLVRTLDARTPQVMIEARIVQADTSFAQSLGIQWGIGFSHLDSNSIFNLQGVDSGGTIPGFADFNPNFGVNLPGAVSGLSSVPTVGFSFGRFTDNPINLDLRLSAGELNGFSKTISSPRITTLDNVQAKIEQGESIPFQTTSQQGTQTQFVDANLTLEVTPHITSDRSIQMVVKAARNAIGSFSGPAGPSISKREATTEVLVRDGETTVIGGIFVDESGETKSGVPLLSKIPILGRLFKSESKTESKNELLIFLTPKIITD